MKFVKFERHNTDYGQCRQSVTVSLLATCSPATTKYVACDGFRDYG